jgi:hypothetical protein
MVNRIALAAAVAASMVACAALVDLGPEATLRDAGVDLDTGVTLDAGDDTTAEMPDTAAPDTGGPVGPDAMYACGLPPTPNVACSGCSDQNCCDLGIACGMHPRCAEGMSKLLDCVFQTACVAQVDTEYADAGVLQFQTCVLDHCIQQCFPKMICSQLARCCQQIPPNMLAAQQTCIGAVNALDESNCQNILDNVLRPQLGEQFCGGPGPADGGGE